MQCPPSPVVTNAPKSTLKSFENAKIRVRALATKAGIDFEPTQTGYPHFAYLDDQAQNNADLAALQIGGEHVRQYLNTVLSSDIEQLAVGQKQTTSLLANGHQIETEIGLLNPTTYQLTLPKASFGLAAAWLRDLSDGFIAVDQDILKKSYGPVWGSRSPPR